MTYQKQMSAERWLWWVGMSAAALGIVSQFGAAFGQQAYPAGPVKPTTTSPAYPRINMAVGYRVDPTWPIRPITHPWGDVPAVVVDGQDQVWSFNRGRMPVQVFSPEGKLVQSWGEGKFEVPHGMRLDRQGNVWVTDCGLHTVQKFSSKGELLLTIGTRGEPGADERHMNRPTDLAIDSNGDVFVSDGYGNSRIVQFDSQGRFIKAWGKMGVKPGEFSVPHGIAMDSQGRLYVCDRNNARVQVFNRQGELLDQWNNLLVPWCIWITPKDEILISGCSPMHWGQEEELLSCPPKDQLVMKFTPDGRVKELWTFPLGQLGKEQPGEVNWLHGLASDSRGDLYLGDIKGRRLQKFIRLTPP